MTFTHRLVVLLAAAAIVAVVAVPFAAQAAQMIGWQQNAARLAAVTTGL